MTNSPHKNLDFSSDIQKYGLKIATFKINFYFLPSDQVILKKSMLDSFVSIWKEYLENVFSVPDFTIVIGEEAKSFNSYIKGDDVYLSTWRWDMPKKKVIIYNLYSIWIIQFVLRQVMVILLKGKGFLLHASAVIGGDGVLRGFMAKSGGGKSTTALSAAKHGMRHMGDDMLIFMKSDKKWVCYGSKFLEKAFLPTDFSLQSFRLYEVHKSTKLATSIEVKRYGEKLKILLAQVWTYDAPVDELAYNLLLDFAKEVKLYKLYLSLNPSNLKEALE